MTLAIAIAAGIGCSLCNGISTVQQKVGADDMGGVRSFDLTFMIRILRNVPYVLGTLLATMGYALSLVALRVLPLFMEQSLLAASVIVTAFGEHFFLHRPVSRRTYTALVIVIIGLVLLSVGAVPGPASIQSHLAEEVVGIAPYPIALLGAIFLYKRGSLSTFSLAALSGLLFGDTSAIGRILTYPHPLWKLLEDPLVYSLVFSAIMGQYLFIVSLQRTVATKSNAVMVAMQTVGPTICGLLLFGDKIRGGFQGLVILGCLLVMLGAITTALEASPPTI